MGMRLAGKVAWVTGAGSGIGRASALALAGEGAKVALSGRRAETLAETAALVKEKGSEALVLPGDLARAAVVEEQAGKIAAAWERLDILVNNAGLNVTRRAWAELSPEGIDEVLGANLHAAFYCARAALALMRPRREGLLIHTSSIAGKQVSVMSGPAYSAAKHAVVAMSQSINMEECIHGIRSTVICPGEVATPILDRRPIPVSAEERARMLKAEDVADLILYVALTPPHVCLNEVVITPTWNRAYVAALSQRDR
jgi:NADP-dependent 3-hydroxy acid dehydrogenase YdfG